MRQIVKNIINPARKLRSTSFCFATETKNVFTLPKMYAINPTALNEVTSAISESYTVKMLAYIFRDNIKYFTHLHVSAIYEHILSKRLEIDDTLHSIIIPITIEYINVYTIQNATGLGQIALCSAKLNIEHEKFWEAIFAKLDGQNIYKYLTLDQTVRLLNALVEQGTFINHSLVAKLSTVVATQKAYYSNFPELLKLIRETNKILQEKGPKTLQISEAYTQIA